MDVRLPDIQKSLERVDETATMETSGKRDINPLTDDTLDYKDKLL